MYIYSFERHAWHDKVFFVDIPSSEYTWKSLSAGDLISIDEQLCLVLWDIVSFVEQYVYAWESPKNIELILGSCLAQQTIECLHRMTYYRYTQYKKIIPMFLTQSFTTYFRLFKKRKTSKLFHVPLLWHAWVFWKDNTQNTQKDTTKNIWQHLIVFPNAWSLHTSLLGIEDVSLYKQLPSTDRQKIASCNSVRTWRFTTYACTFGNMFVDRVDLQSITCVDSHMRYYASQQDPRYKVVTVLEEFARIHKATLHCTSL